MRQTLVSLLSAASLMVGRLDVLWTNLPVLAGELSGRLAGPVHGLVPVSSGNVAVQLTEAAAASTFANAAAQPAFASCTSHPQRVANIDRVFALTDAREHAYNAL